MPDYKEMYLTLFRASEEALDILIAVRRRNEDKRRSAGGEKPARAEERAGERSPALNVFYGRR